MKPVALEIAGTGMVTALGASTRETIAALERGDCRTTQTHLVDLRGDRITGAFALPVRSDLSGVARAERLVVPALTECLGSLDPAASSVRGPTALVVCAPLPWGSFGADFAPAVAPVHDEWTALTCEIAAHLEDHGLRGCSERPWVVHRGHAAGVLALCHIQKLFERGEAAQAVIVGIDTHGDRATLERLDLAGLLRSRRSPGGFVPGEAAAVLWLRPVRDGSPEPGAKSRVARNVIRGIGRAMERDPPITACGLTAAISEALCTWGGAPRSIATVAIDLNGERRRAQQWAFSATRTLWRERATPLLVHPAARLGDVGAATLPLLLGLLARRASPSEPALAVASSRDRLCAGVVLGDRLAEPSTRAQGDPRSAPVAWPDSGARG